MRNKEPSNHGPLSKQLTTANEQCTLQVTSQKLISLICNRVWQSITAITHHSIWGMTRFKL
jgi:hypothetical protein